MSYPSYVCLLYSLLASQEGLLVCSAFAYLLSLNVIADWLDFLLCISSHFTPGTSVTVIQPNVAGERGRVTCSIVFCLDK